MRAKGAAALLAATVLAGCGGQDLASPEPAPPSPPSTPSQAPVPPPCDPMVQVAALPLDARLRQLLFAGVWTGDGDPMAEATAAVAAGVGGINFLGPDSQTYADGQVKAVAAAAPQFAPFLAIDEEGGRVQRLKSIGASEPSPRAMGQTMTPAQVQALAGSVGQEMAALGLNMDLAPVADVSSQPDNAVIGDRSFSSDPAQVAAYAGAYADGLRSAGITPVFKHFPGMGSASGNTDQVAATTPALAQLMASDLIPYRTLLIGNPEAVMLANAVVPGLTDEVPASLSSAAVELLRTDFGFESVVMTDSLSGGAIAHPLPEAAELALVAGVDMVLWDNTTEIDAIVSGLTAAVSADRLSETRVNESVARVLALKNIDLCAAG